MEAEEKVEFVPKLYRMLEEPSYKNIVGWSQDGKSFAIYDTNTFQELVIPQVFKHSNFSSFVRQLNKYDFHKVKFKDSQAKVWEFEHPDFHPGNRDKPFLIKRKTPQKRKLVPNDLIEEFQRQLDELTDRIESVEATNRTLMSMVTEQRRLIDELQSGSRNKSLGFKSSTTPRILVAVDDEEAPRICAQFVYDYNHGIVDQASSGIQVVELAEQHDYQCIIVDLVLTSLDGLSVTEVIRGQGFANPVILCVLDEPVPEKRTNFRLRGVTSVLKRPFNRQALYDELRSVGV